MEEGVVYNRVPDLLAKDAPRTWEARRAKSGAIGARTRFIRVRGRRHHDRRPGSACLSNKIILP